MKTKYFRWVMLVLLLLPFPLHAEAPSPATDEQAQAAIEKFLASLHFKDGKIDLPGGIATLNLPSSFRYLDPQDTEGVLTEAWGNPPGNSSLGMIVPTNTSLLSAEGWGVIITYDEDGHVKDDDADSIDYKELLEDMQKATQEANEERKKQGYDTLTLVGWAESPHYDKDTHKLYWAKELASEHATQHSLNYNIRVLGRQGVLVLNGVAGMSQIGQIRQEMQKVIAFTEFTSGNTYTDFNSSTDKTAAYGIAALVAGGAAAKMGLFAKLLALLLAFKKFVILGAIALAAGIKKFFFKPNS